MKIHQLPLGTRFEYEGGEYAKTGPLSAADPAGKQRLIPKYAILKPLGPIEPQPDPQAATLPRARVLDAFETFYASCAAWLPEDRQEALRAARDRFLGNLKDR